MVPEKSVSPEKATTKSVMEVPVIISDPDLVERNPLVSRDPKVPFRNLIDYIEGGHSVGEILLQFPAATHQNHQHGLTNLRKSGSGSVDRELWTNHAIRKVGYLGAFGRKTRNSPIWRTVASVVRLKRTNFRGRPYITRVASRNNVLAESLKRNPKLHFQPPALLPVHAS